MNGTIFVICGPSGVGKTSVATAALAKLAPRHTLNRVITYTTRAARIGETDGKDYYFITSEKFKALKAQGFFFEVVSFNNNLYGSPVSFINDAQKGISSLVIPDLNGALALVARVTTPIVFIALLPPSIDILRKRLQSRKTDSEAVIEQRLDIGIKELEEIKKHTFFIQLINDDFNATVNELVKLIENRLS